MRKAPDRHAPGKGFGRKDSLPLFLSLRLVRRLDIAPASYSAVVGSITLRTAATEFAGNPPCVACSRTMASFGAM